MANKTKTYALLTILLLIAVSTGLFFIQQSYVGGTILSLQKTEFLSSDPIIGGSAWLLTFLQNGGSQYVQGTIDSNQITAGGKTAKNDLTVTLSSSPQVCSYNIISQNLPIKNIEVVKKTGYFTQSSCVSACSGYDATFCNKPSWQFTYDAYCFKKTTTGVFGSVAYDKLQFTSDIMATIAGKDYKSTISNANTNSVYLGSGNEVYASWAGNLVSGENCPAPADQNVAAMYKNGAWSLTSRDAYNKYAAYDISGLQLCLGRGGTTPSACADEYNSFSNSAQLSEVFIAAGGERAIAESISSQTGKAKITLNKIMQFPLFVMRIKASVLGIVAESSKPVIVKAGSECFKTGTDGFVVADIKNDGGFTSTFVSSVSCDSVFEQSGTAIRTQFSPGELKTINIPITAEALKETKKQCSLTVHDLENPLNKASASTTLCVQPIVLCEKGEARCNGNIKEACVLGSGWEVVSGDTSCQKEIDCTKTPDAPGCKKPFVLDEFKLLVSVISALVIFGIVYWFAGSKFGKKKQDNFFRLVLSFGLAAAFGIFIYIYLYPVLIVAGILIVLMIIIKQVLK